MRTVTIQYNDTGFRIDDCDGQWIDVDIEGENASFLSQLNDDESPVSGSTHAENAIAEALFVMGVLM